MLIDFQCVGFIVITGGLLSYSTIQGHRRGENWSFYDNTYDGLWDGNYLRNGLGLLTDGRGGPTNFKDDFYANNERGGYHYFTCGKSI